MRMSGVFWGVEYFKGELCVGFLIIFYVDFGFFSLYFFLCEVFFYIYFLGVVLFCVLVGFIFFERSFQFCRERWLFVFQVVVYDLSQVVVLEEVVEYDVGFFFVLVEVLVYGDGVDGYVDTGVVQQVRVQQQCFCLCLIFGFVGEEGLVRFRRGGVFFYVCWKEAIQLCFKV